jgi:peptidoglycan/LPS O-acetylase OafA/YrhL
MSATPPLGLRYEPHLDGLRGLAVLLVVVFHAFPDTAPGGFVGVDVFFVLSGYLITRLILKERDEGRFRYGGFLGRRVRRLAPAFLIVTGATLAFAWQGLFPEDLIETASAAAAALVLSANWYFFANAGYFDADAQTNLFLHAWSLSVEEQFYLVYPLVLIAVPARRRVAALIGLWAFSLVVAATSVFFLSASEAFFATHTRVWELLSGAVIAVLPGPVGRTAARPILGRLARGSGWFGLLLVLASGFGLKEGAGLPFSLVAVVLGTALLLRIEPVGRLHGIFSSRAAVGLGRISYSLYLWHWPVLTGLRHVMPGAEDGMIFAGVALSVVLSILTYLLVEQPVRRGRLLTHPLRLAGVVGAALIALASSAFFMVSGNGHPSRIPEEARVALAAVDDQGGIPLTCTPMSELAVAEGIETSSKICRVGGEAFVLGERADLLLWGDSHASALLPGVGAAAMARGLDVVTIRMPGCPPALSVAWKGLAASDALECEAANEVAARLVERGVAETVLMAGHWDLYAGPVGGRGKIVPTGGPYSLDSVEGRGAEALLPSLEASIERLAPHAELRFVMDVPSPLTSVPEALAAQARWPWAPDASPMSRGEVIEARRVYAPSVEALAEEGLVTIFEPLEVLCPGPSDRSPCLVAKEGRPLYFDRSHLTSTGARFVVDGLPGLVAPKEDPST